MKNKYRSNEMADKLINMIRKIRQFAWDYSIITLLIIGLIISIFIFFNPSFLPIDNEFEALIAALILYFGILYNILVYKISIDKSFKELFNEFNKRFDNMNEDLNLIYNKNFLSFHGSSRTSESIIIDYLNLCAEEYYWFKKGRIDLKVWESWKKGILFYL
ncbi:hypothetical protein [Algoriphagus namhaensis]